ncbi:MAG TPA: metallophosphoesterase [Blastocatellia bacterium]|nr:metallophosphoesterase [Blastocatellia bacterium]
MNRREFITLAGVGGVVFASSLRRGALASSLGSRSEDFYFVQLSDTHWGFDGPSINPDSQGTLKKAVAAVNGLDQQPDFVVFTGDLTHTTDNAQTRRDRMAQFKDIVGQLKAPRTYFMAGEHDASLDRGEAFQQFFGKLTYTFDHKGVHFVVLDNVSDPQGIIGDSQVSWLQSDLKKFKHDHPIVVLTHRPLFDLYPQWDWTTPDGTNVINQLLPFQHVTVFYGHIHQEHHFKTAHIEHHAAKSLMFPLPAPGSVPKRAPVAWDSAAPYRGLGFRDVEAEVRNTRYDLKEIGISKS